MRQPAMVTVTPATDRTGLARPPTSFASLHGSHWTRPKHGTQAVESLDAARVLATTRWRPAPLTHPRRDSWIRDSSTAARLLPPAGGRPGFKQHFARRLRSQIDEAPEPSASNIPKWSPLEASAVNAGLDSRTNSREIRMPPCIGFRLLRPGSVAARIWAAPG